MIAPKAEILASLNAIGAFHLSPISTSSDLTYQLIDVQGLFKLELRFAGSVLMLSVTDCCHLRESYPAKSRRNHAEMEERMNALIIDEPWIGKILRGEKTWEMRKTACHLRGPFALIQKGSGAVVGIAEMIGSLNPIGSREAYAEAERYHGIPPDRQERAFTDGWTTPWVLANARALEKPVVYPHPSGAVVWVKLDPTVEGAVRAELGGSGTSPMPGNPTSEPATAPMPKVPAVVRLPTTPPPPPTPSGDADVRSVVLTGGNIRNNHIYLPLDFFPRDAIGGGRKAELASRTISVTFQPGLTCETDIDGEKRILRARGPVGDFVVRAGLNEGDIVLITRHSDYSYTIAKAPSGRKTTA